MEILAIFTCFNRCEKTKKCIETITSGNPGCNFTFVVAGDGSTDGTFEMLQRMKERFPIHVLRGTGQWYYSGGMRAGMEYALQELPGGFDYLLMINDDVSFFDNSIQKLICQSRQQDGSLVVGAMCNASGSLSYGAVKYIAGYRYRTLSLSDWEVPADTFNANCVLIPYEAFVKTGAMDPSYRHSLGDFDYGLSLKQAGYRMYQSREFAGCCETNSPKNTWQDTSLSRMERIRKKEDVKGAPAKQWFYFLKKHFGLPLAMKGTITPYIRILIGK